MRNSIKFEKQRHDRKAKVKRKLGMAEAKVDIQVSNSDRWRRLHGLSRIELPSSFEA